MKIRDQWQDSKTLGSTFFSVWFQCMFNFTLLIGGFCGHDFIDFEINNKLLIKKNIQKPILSSCCLFKIKVIKTHLNEQKSHLNVYK